MLLPLPQGEGAAVSEGEALQGLAFLSMLFNTSWAVSHGTACTAQLAHSYWM